MPKVKTDIGWIEPLYDRWTARHALHSAYLLRTMNRFIAEEADAQPGGRDQLRGVALAQLDSDDAQVIALSLVFLGVVGQADDLANVERYLGHSTELVQRAARTCKFELQRTSPE